MDRPKEARRSWRSCGSVGSAIREVQLEARRSACGPGPQQPGVEGTQDKGLQGWREPRSWITTLLRWPAIAMPLMTMEQPDRTSNAKWGTGLLRLFFRKMSERKRFCLILVAGSRITRNVNLLRAAGMTRATVAPAERREHHATEQCAIASPTAAFLPGREGMGRIGSFTPPRG